MAERRQYRRAVGVVETAEVTAHRKTVTFRVESLSAGGASISGELPLEIGEHIKLAFAIDGRVATIAAEVARHEHRTDGASVGVAFRGMSEQIADRIEQAVMMTLEHQRATAPPSVLIFDANGERSAALERELVTLGFLTKRATTSHEATQYLDDLSVRYEAVVLGSSPELDPMPFIVFLELAHTRLRRVLVTSSGESVDPALHKRMRTTIDEPWEAATLKRALVDH